MQFAGKTSKFNKGQIVYCLTDNGNILVRVEDIGILGGKLSNWAFLYHVKDYDGNGYDVTEERLSGTNK